jgi:threonine dehydrogenase-like Zn-dependent dehydrogenase
VKAAVFHGAGDVRIEDVPRPGPLAPDAVRLAIQHAAICGSDAAEFRAGPHAIPLTVAHPANGHVGPTTIGHEFVGTVVEVGRDVDPTLLGRRAVSGAGVWCETCRYCRRGRPNLCEQYYTLGLQADGGLAEEVVAPVRTCVPVPDGVATELAAIAQPLAVALHALSRGGPGEGATVAIFGVGGVGALAVAGACARGAANVIAVDVDPARLATATALGATHALVAADPDLVAQVRAVAGGDGPEIVLEASGRQRALDAAIAACGRGGRIVAVGVHADPPSVDLRSLTHRELELVGTVAHVCDRDLVEAMALLDGYAPLRDLARRVIELDDVVADGLEPLSAGEAGAKIIVKVH